MARPLPKGVSGNPAGKPKGAKDKFPRSARRAIEGLLERFGTDIELLENTLRKGLTARPGTSFPYLKLLIEQHMGAPDQHIDLAAAMERKAIDELHPGPGKTS